MDSLSAVENGPGRPPEVEGPAAAHFRDLLRDYGRVITSVVAAVGGRAVAQVREDVEQEVRLSLWCQLQAERVIQHPCAYVYRTAVRETVRWVKRELARPAELVGDVVAGPDANPLKALVTSQQRAALERCLRRLSTDRERAVRAHLAGFDVQATMRMFDWSYQRARNLIARGMADLRVDLSTASPCE